MRVSKGWQDALTYQALRSDSNQNIVFFSGDPLTSEELKKLESRDPGTIFYSTYISVVYVLSRMEALGRTPLCNFKFSQTTGYEITEANKQVFTLDMSALPNKVVHKADGIIGNAIWVGTSSDPFNANVASATSQRVVFMSVGLPGSGADIELTQLEYESGDDIRMNNLEIVVNI